MVQAVAAVAPLVLRAGPCGEAGAPPRIDSAGDRYYLVATEAGEIAGYGGLLVAGAQADLVTLGVATERWGHGIGAALLRALIGETARRGCSELFLEVRVDNERAQRLYRRHGFEGIGVRRGYYQPSGADALVMRRPIDPGEASAAPPGTSSPRRTAREALT